MKSLEQLRTAVFESIGQLQKEAFDLNYDLADHPENPGEEVYACQQYYSILEKHGIPVVKEYGGVSHAFKATIKSDPSSKLKVGILAEYDALPEIGHGCGHCASGSLSLLAALALHANADDLVGNVDLIGTPDEEATGKKVDLAELGLFDDYSFVIMIHMNTKNLIKANFMALAAFHYNFRGCPAHAAAFPWEGRNALNGAMLMIHGMDMLRQHVKPDTRIHGIITHGGDANNTIPEYVTTDYVVRYPDSEYLAGLIEMLHNCARGAAMATRTEVEIDEYAPKLDSLRANHTGEELLEDVFAELEIPLFEGDNENMGSSDIGNVSWRCPAFHPTLAVTDQQDLALHTKEFAALMKNPEIEMVIDRGAKVISLMIMKAMTDPALVEAMRNEFEKTVK